MTDWPILPEHIFLMIYTAIAVIVMGIVTDTYKFQCL